MELRDGNWYSTALDIAGAHKTPDGRSVGIYVRGGYPLVPDPNNPTTLIRGDYVPPRVVIQAEDGHDLLMLVNREVKIAEFPPEKLPDLRPVKIIDHLPASRWDKTVYPAGTRIDGF